MPTLLLSVFFAVGLLIEPSPIPLSPEPLNNQPELDSWGWVNTYEWDTNAGWVEVIAIPDGSKMVTLDVPAGNEIYRGMGNGASEVAQWAPLVAGQFPPDQLENALCVIKSESGGNTLAKNPRSNARGLFQVMSSIWGPEFGFSHEDFYVPELNVYAAARIWERSGWVPWSPRTRRNCGL